MLMRKEAKSIMSRNQPAIAELKKRGVGKLLVESIVKDLVESKVKHNLHGYGCNNKVKTKCGTTKIWLERNRIKYHTTITITTTAIPQCAVMQD